MADQEYIISIPVDVQDKTEPGASEAQRKIDHMTKDIHRFKGEVAGVDGSLGKFGAIVNKTFTGMGRLIRGVLSPIRMIGRSIFSLPGMIAGGAGFMALVKAPLEMADNFEQARVGFETMLGSSSKANKMMREIQDFAIKTPFETADVVNQTQKMLTMGWQPDRLISDMERIGNASASLGKGKEGVDSIILALGQIRMKGKLQGDELLQLVNAGVNARKYLTKSLGVDMKTLDKMIGKGLVDSNKAVDTIIEGLKEFDGQMDKTANRTAQGLWSQIKDTFNVTLLMKWGAGIQKGLIGGMDRFNGYLSKNRATLERWGDSLEKISEGFTKGMVGGIEKFVRNMDRAFSSSAWRKADTLTEKLQIVWENVVTEPFDEWWNGGGKAQVASIAEQVGVGFGSTLKGFVEAALGVVDGAKNKDPFAEAGATAGRKFFEGFLKAIDPPKLAAKLAEGVPKAIGNTAVNAATGKMDSGNWLTLLGLGYLGWKFRGKLFGGGGKGIPTPTPGEMPAPGAGRVPDVPGKQILDRFGKPIVRDAAEVAPKAKGFLDIFKDVKFLGWLKNTKPAQVMAQTGKNGMLANAGEFAKKGWLAMALGALEVATADGPRAKMKAAGKNSWGLAGAEMGGTVGMFGGPVGSFLGGALGYSVLSALYERMLDSADKQWGSGKIKKQNAQTKAKVNMDQYFAKNDLKTLSQFEQQLIKDFYGFQPNIEPKKPKLAHAHMEYPPVQPKKGFVVEDKGKPVMENPPNSWNTPYPSFSLGYDLGNERPKIIEENRIKVPLEPSSNGMVSNKTEGRKKEQEKPTRIKVDLMTPPGIPQSNIFALRDDQFQALAKSDRFNPTKILGAQEPLINDWMINRPLGRTGIDASNDKWGSKINFQVKQETTPLELLREYRDLMRNQGARQSQKESSTPPYKPIAAPSGRTITLKIDVTDQSKINLHTKADAADIVKILQQKKGEFANDVAGIIAKKLIQNYSNTPVLPYPMFDK